MSEKGIPIRLWPPEPSVINKCTDTGVPRQFAPSLGSHSTKIGPLIEGRFQGLTGNTEGSTRNSYASFVKLNGVHSSFAKETVVWTPG